MHKYAKIFAFGLVIAGIVRIAFCENVLDTEQQKGVTVSSINKSVQNQDRYKNNSTAPSAIKIQLRDKKTGQVLNAVVRNDDFSQFYRGELKLTQEEYVNSMIKNDDSPLEINLDKFKKALGKRWLGKVVSGEAYLNKYVIYESPMTFQQLEVNNETELINKYFDFDQKKGRGILKGQYNEAFARNPAFIALLINLGYDAYWGDYIPNLNISVTPFISRLKNEE
ncbi:MAG: hypothetical protein V1709_08290 [Planctomycetota bacterium]